MKEIEKKPNFYRLLLLQLITSVFKIHNMWVSGWIFPHYFYRNDNQIAQEVWAEQRFFTLH